MHTNEIVCMRTCGARFQTVVVLHRLIASVAAAQGCHHTLSAPCSRLHVLLPQRTRTSFDCQRGGGTCPWLCTIGCQVLFQRRLLDFICVNVIWELFYEKIKEQGKREERKEMDKNAQFSAKWYSNRKRAHRHRLKRAAHCGAQCVVCLGLTFPCIPFAGFLCSINVGFETI